MEMKDTMGDIGGEWRGAVAGLGGTEGSCSIETMRKVRR